MKRYRVWAYDSVGYYLEIDAQNKSDAYNKAMDNHVDDWEKDTRNYLNLKIKKKDIEHIDSNVVEFKPKEPWAVGYKKWKEESND